MVWHGYLPDIGRASSTAIAFTGLYEPEKGHRFNPNKVLLDPYAKAIGRRRSLERRSRCGYKLGDPQADLSFDNATARRSRRWPRSSIRRSPGATIGRPRTPWHETIIYEAARQGLHAS